MRASGKVFRDAEEIDALSESAHIDLRSWTGSLVTHGFSSEALIGAFCLLCQHKFVESEEMHYVLLQWGSEGRLVGICTECSKADDKELIHDVVSCRRLKWPLGMRPVFNGMNS